MSARPQVPGPFVRLPPGRGFVAVPVGRRAEALAGLGVVPVSGRGAVVRLRVAAAATALLGPRVLPGERQGGWTPPCGPEVWDRVSADWQDLLGPTDGLVVHERPQASRDGVALLLLRAGRPAAFVKLRRAGADGRVAAQDAEHDALAELAHRPSAAVRTARPLGRGTAGSDPTWCWLATTTMPAGPHRPVLAGAVDLAAVRTAVLRAAGAALGARPDDVAAHWEPAHGDLTPWNLRQRRRGSRRCRPRALAARLGGRPLGPAGGRRGLPAGHDRDDARPRGSGVAGAPARGGPVLARRGGPAQPGRRGRGAHRAPPGGPRDSDLRSSPHVRVRLLCVRDDPGTVPSRRPASLASPGDHDDR